MTNVPDSWNPSNTAVLAAVDLGRRYLDEGFSLADALDASCRGLLPEERETVESTLTANPVQVLAYDGEGWLRWLNHGHRNPSEAVAQQFLRGIIEGVTVTDVARIEQSPISLRDQIEAFAGPTAVARLDMFCRGHRIAIGPRPHGYVIRMLGPTRNIELLLVTQ